MATQHTDLFENISEGAASTAFLDIISNLNNSPQDLENVPFYLLRAVVDNTSIDKCWAGVLDLETRTWSNEFHHGFDSQAVSNWKERTDYLAENEPSLVAIRSGSPLTIGDIRQSTEFATRYEQEGYASSLYVPVKLSEHEWTVLSFHRSVPHVFSKDEQDLASSIAAFAAVSFRNTIAKQRALQLQEITSQQLKAQNKLLNQQSELHLKFIQMQLFGATFGGLAQLAADETTRPLIIADRFFQIVASAGIDAASAQSIVEKVKLQHSSIEKLTGVTKLQDKTTQSTLLIGSVSNGQSNCGIAITALDETEHNQEPIHNLFIVSCLYFSLEFAKQLYGVSTELTLHDNFIESLMDGTGEVSKRAQVLGIDLSKSHTVLVAEVENISQDLPHEVAGELLAFIRNRLKHGSQHIVASFIRPSKFIFTIPAEVNVAKFAHDLRKHLKLALAMLGVSGSKDLSVSIGIGESGSGADGLIESSFGANRALEVLYSKGEIGTDLHFSEVGSYAVLSLTSTAEREKFSLKYLQPIISHDIEHQTELMETLKMYFNEVGNVQQTANKLFLHISTVRHRLSRIESLSNLSLKDEDDRLCLQIALRLTTLLAG